MTVKKGYRLDEGPGLKILNNKTWYGGGYCGICGHRGEHLVPIAVRYWDPDDGWRVGVLCSYCADDAALRGPQPDDYASHGADEQEERIDVITEAYAGDMDGVYADNEDLA